MDPTDALVQTGYLVPVDHQPDFSQEFDQSQYNPTRVTVTPQPQGWQGQGGSAQTPAVSNPAAAPPPLDTSRDQFVDELDNPYVRQRFQRLIETEVGGQGPQATQAFVESVMNRAVARGQTLWQAMNDRGYYPRVSLVGRTPTNTGMYDSAIEGGLRGSNISNYATGNASGTVGFAGGPQTYAPGTGERFGIEGPDRNWAATMAAGQPLDITPPSQYGPAYQNWQSPVANYTPEQRAAIRVRESVQPSRGRAYGPTAEAVSSTVIPQTPLDVGLMAAGGPYSKLFRFLAPMAGYALTSDEAQAGVGGGIKKGAKTLADYLLGKFESSQPQEIVNKLRDQGGYSVHLGTGEVPQEGLMVGKYANTDPRNTVLEPGSTSSDLEAVARKNAKLYERPDIYFSSWRDPETGKMYFEPSQRFGQDELRKATKFGERTGQISGYNAQAGETFPIGNWEQFVTGTGPHGPEFKNRMSEMAKEGRDYLSQFPAKEWWDMHGSPFERAWGAENLPQAAGFTGATAPNSSPAENLRVMSEYMRRHIKGEPVIQPDWRAGPGNQWLAEGKQMPMEKARVGNLTKAAAGKYNELGGDKVRNEAQAMMGDPNAVVLDRHWARIAEKPSAGVFTNVQEGVIRGDEYETTKKAVTEAAKELGRDPRDFSADVWTGIRERLKKYAELYGVKYKKGAVTGESKSYADILDDLIASKAEFRGMSRGDLEKRLRAGDDNLLSWVLTTPIGAGAFYSILRSGKGQAASTADRT